MAHGPNLLVHVVENSWVLASASHFACHSISMQNGLQTGSERVSAAHAVEGLLRPVHSCVVGDTLPERTPQAVAQVIRRVDTSGTATPRTRVV